MRVGALSACFTSAPYLLDAEISKLPTILPKLPHPASLAISVLSAMIEEIGAIIFRSPLFFTLEITQPIHELQASQIDNLSSLLNASFADMRKELQASATERGLQFSEHFFPEQRTWQTSCLFSQLGFKPL